MCIRDRLDADSEEKVQNAIANLTKNKTTLVIAHRLSTIIKADKIIVINPGVEPLKELSKNILFEAEDLLQNKSPRLITVSRLDKRKNHEKTQSQNKLNTSKKR